MSTIKTDIRIDVQRITDRIESTIHSEDVLTEANQVLANIIDPWVPYDTGALSQNIEVDATGITYKEPYAARQYYGEEFHHNHSRHPLATAYWDKVAMQTERETLAMQIKEILARRLNNG